MTPTSAAAANSSAVLRRITRHIGVLGGGRVLGGVELQNFAFGDHRRGLRDHGERRDHAGLDHHLEGVAEQEVADQHAGLIAPQHARRDLAAAHVALVHDIVMEQRRGVHELDAGGEFEMAVALVAAHAGGGEHEHRPQALAARGDEMIGDLGNRRDVGAGALNDQLIGALAGRAG